ncbi:MAG: CDC27 family protein [Acidobacteriota bacterium]
MSACILVLAVATATTSPPPPTCDAECERRAAVACIEGREYRLAVDRLRAAVDRFPDDRGLALLLARAYLLDGNHFWAERTLRAALDRSGNDAALRLWLACVHLRQGDPDLAHEALRVVAEPPEGPLTSRERLLVAFQRYLDSRHDEARAALGGVGRTARVFPEDRPTWSTLQRRLDPSWLDPITAEFEAGVGYSSNAQAGSPTDPGTSGTESALADAAIRSRLAPPLGSRVVPVLDVEAIGRSFDESTAREFGSLHAALRPGVRFALGRQTILVGFRGERLYLDQTPSLYSEARRGELEIEWPAGALAFTGVGRRDYRDERRSRDEWDLGFGGPFGALRGVSLIAGATVRGADASSPAYDVIGVSAAAAARVALGRGASLRLTGTVVWDDYPHSGGEEGAFAFGTDERRQDLLGKVSLGVWIPAWRGARLGLECQLARRDSTADDRPGFNLDYAETRARVLLRWSLSSDPWAPRTVSPPDHVPLPWGLGPGESGDDERIIDLLRQDEELRRGSSCGV